MCCTLSIQELYGSGLMSLLYYCGNTVWPTLDASNHVFKKKKRIFIVLLGFARNFHEDLYKTLYSWRTYLFISIADMKWLRGLGIWVYSKFIVCFKLRECWTRAQLLSFNIHSILWMGNKEHLNSELRQIMANCYMWSVLVYWVEAYTLNCQQWMLKIPLTVRKTTEEVLDSYI